MKRMMIFAAIFLCSFLFLSQAAPAQYSGMVNDNAVRIRIHPGLDGEITGRLNRGAKVSVIGRTNARMFIDGYDSYWLDIEAGTVRGWVYGAYINLLDCQYDQLPIRQHEIIISVPDLNYSRDLPDEELIAKEKEALQQQTGCFFTGSIEDYYRALVTVFNRHQSLRPFFANSVEAGVFATDRFYKVSSSILCDYIQTNYSTLQISELYAHNDSSASFYINGFTKDAVFSGIEIRTVTFNLQKIENTRSTPLAGKVIVDNIIICPWSLDELEKEDVFFQGSFYETLINIPYSIGISQFLLMILE